MQIIGLTGGIATGKSTASSYIKDRLGVPVVDADIIARQVVEPGQPAYKRIVEQFPDCIDAQSGRIDRGLLGQRVFTDQSARRQLNRLTHPAIRRAIATQLFKHWLKHEPLVVLDAPLLYESSLDCFMDCNEQHQLSRLLQRNKELSREQAEQRIRAQLPVQCKADWAQWVWWNDGETPEELHRQIHRSIQPLLDRRLQPSILRWLLWISWPVRVTILSPWRFLVASWRNQKRRH